MFATKIEMFPEKVIIVLIFYAEDVKQKKPLFAEKPSVLRAVFL